MSSRKRSRVADDSTTPETVSRPRVDRVVIDVGGRTFTTSRSTLTAASAYFEHCFSDRWDQDDSEPCFLDRDPEPFVVLLSFMRSGMLELPESDASLARRVMHEAEFLGVDGLLRHVKSRAHRNMHPTWTGTDLAAEAAFDEQHGGLVPAMHSGILPDRYFAPEATPPEPKVVQTFPAPPGCQVRVHDGLRWTSFKVHCLARVENPRQLPRMKSAQHLDAYVTCPTSFGSVLASEVYGDQTNRFELLPPVIDEMLALPEGLNLSAEFWKDSDDHDKGTFSRDVRMLRKTVDEDGDEIIYPVELRQDGAGVEWLKVSDWKNFKEFSC